jgi:NTE family protein
MGALRDIKCSMADKALVLGGGGLTGIAWETGILAGLAEHGVDLTDADLVVGTSAGSVVGVDVRTGQPVAALFEAQSAPSAPTEVYAKMGGAVMLRYATAVAFTRKPLVAGRRIGKVALRSKTETEAERRRIFETRMPTSDWPVGDLKITAVDTVSGEFTVFDSNSGVSLIDAVGASCAVPGIWPPVTINGKRYMDGGMRSATNADLAAGYQRVVVIAPLHKGFGPIAGVTSQVRLLEAQGSQVVVVRPDSAALQAIGKNVLDPANRPAAAASGHTQSAVEAPAVAAVWNG